MKRWLEFPVGLVILLVGLVVISFLMEGQQPPSPSGEQAYQSRTSGDSQPPAEVVSTTVVSDEVVWGDPTYDEGPPRNRNSLSPDEIRDARPLPLPKMDLWVSLIGAPIRVLFRFLERLLI